jgi:hypothetical protein
MWQRGIALIGLSVVAASGVQLPALSQSSDFKADIYILAGQSNMSGRGALGLEIPPELSPDPNILVYGNDGQSRVAAEPLDRADNQIDAISIDTQAGVGPGLVFAKALRQANPKRKIILVPCAKGGSFMAQWRPHTAQATLYGSCLARVREVQGQGRLAGILWYQGESDARDILNAQLWPQRFSHLINQFRSDLNAKALHVLLIGLGDQPQVGRYADQFPHWKLVQDAQSNFVMSNVRYVSAAGLPKLDDDLHLSTQGQIELGQNAANVWLRER